MSTLKVTTIQNTSGVEVYTCKAWVNFNGTGTVAIRSSGNVSSITDNGTGAYTVNFTNAMPNANYCISGMAGFGLTDLINVSAPSSYITTTSCRVETTYVNSSVYDSQYIGVSIFSS